MRKLMEWISRKMTKDYHDIPLLWVSFDLNKYEAEGSDGSCMCYMHPEIQNDPELIKMMCDVVDYIRDNYDMKRLTEI